MWKEKTGKTWKVKFDSNYCYFLDTCEFWHFLQFYEWVIIWQHLICQLKKSNSCKKILNFIIWQAYDRKERVNKREEKRVEKKRKFISSILFVFEVSVLVMLSIKTLTYLHGKKSKRIWLLANSFYLLYTANYLSEFYSSPCESIFKSNKNEE